MRQRYRTAWTAMLSMAAVLCAPLPMLSAQTWPGSSWQTASPESVGMSSAALQQAQNFATSAGSSTGGSGYVIKNGKLIWSWGSASARYDIKSATKGFGSAALGLAIGSGQLQLDDQVQAYLPSVGTPPQDNATYHANWLSQIRFRDLAGHTAGFGKDGGYQPINFQPGTKWSYSDSGFNWLADALTVTFQNDLYDVLTDEVFERIGIPSGHVTWRDNYYRSNSIEDPFNPGTYYTSREFASGIDASVDAMARFGYLWLHGGQWNGQQIIPAGYVQQAKAPLTTNPSALPVDPSQPDADQYGEAPLHSGLGWWNNADSVMSQVPTDTFWAWGLHDNLIIVIPSLDLVVARTGNSGEDWDPSGDLDYVNVIEPFFNLLLSQASAMPGDANLDGQVNIGDLQIIGDHWQVTGATWFMGDFSGDGIVNLADLQIISDHWSGGAADLAAIVPEPSSGLGLTALMILPASRHLRRRGGEC
ncbi:MAG: serine hydrolase [Phycisphaeraceae bacterium]|nr:serine hydrolase [Phycisphaeraceae bacterium]